MPEVQEDITEEVTMDAQLQAQIITEVTETAEEAVTLEPQTTQEAVSEEVTIAPVEKPTTEIMEEETLMLVQQQEQAPEEAAVTFDLKQGTMFIQSVNNHNSRNARMALHMQDALYFVYLLYKLDFFFQFLYSVL